MKVTIFLKIHFILFFAFLGFYLTVSFPCSDGPSSFHPSIHWRSKQNLQVLFLWSFFSFLTSHPNHPCDTLNILGQSFFCRGVSPLSAGSCVKICFLKTFKFAIYHGSSFAIQWHSWGKGQDGIGNLGSFDFNFLRLTVFFFLIIYLSNTSIFLNHLHEQNDITKSSALWFKLTLSGEWEHDCVLTKWEEEIYRCDVRKSNINYGNGVA